MSFTTCTHCSVCPLIKLPFSSPIDYVVQPTPLRSPSHRYTLPGCVPPNSPFILTHRRVPHKFHPSLFYRARACSSRLSHSARVVAHPHHSTNRHSTELVNLSTAYTFTQIHCRFVVHGRAHPTCPFGTSSHTRSTHQPMPLFRPARGLPDTSVCIHPTVTRSTPSTI